ncbi:hypothetical protein [Catalinimonas niigatensis]|uniref:hypothetical protein n=1 Tax=Catalinimonas niigatensis TaxID=1397264 RepID=UPI002666162C|nr:hypothetical protein [Catalinimonas niigatensis]WPP49648.1 hypothetical protein PZB72_23520 [Catalinimonas niigatensis]
MNINISAKTLILPLRPVAYRCVPSKMNFGASILITIFLVLMYSCILDTRYATEQELNDAINNSDFDDKISRELDSYETLKDLLTAHLDTLLDYRNSNNIVIQMGANSQVVDTVLEYEACHSFFNGNSDYDINSVPKFLQKPINRAWSQIGDRTSFTICKNKEIRIVAKTDALGNGLYISHELMWNQANDKNWRRYLLQKDTSLTEDCIYRLGLTEHHGH